MTIDDLSLDERVILESVNAHAMRYTFSTQAAAEDELVNVVQKSVWPRIATADIDLHAGE